MANKDAGKRKKEKEKEKEKEDERERVGRKREGEGRGGMKNVGKMMAQNSLVPFIILYMFK